jgi:phosphatidylinositol alpha-1,6-mannosyltransferase
VRLLLISQDFPPESGGIQTYAYEISRRLAERCSLFTAIVPKRIAGEKMDREIPGKILRLPVRPDMLPLAAIPVLPFLAAEGRFQVALHTQWQTAVASLISRRLTGYPGTIVVAAHGRELRYEPNWIVTRLRPIVTGRVDRFIAVSQFTAGLLQAERVPPARITVVGNGTDPGVFYPADATPLRRSLGLENKTVLLTVGRLTPHKGIDTTLHALGLLKADFPDLHYLIVGKGPDRDRLERLARAGGITEQVHFVGAVPPRELPEYYNACDAFIMASRLDGADVEGFGIAFLEAAACGKPVIGGRSGGTEDAVLEGETGLLVDPGDVRAVADSIRTLLEDPEASERLGKNGRAHVMDTANWDSVADRIYCILQDVVE